MTKTVLLIEDDRWIGDAWQSFFETHGLIVVRAHDGYEAIDRADEAKPAVIVLDIVLPGPNGIAFLQELSSHHDLAAIPVIVVTSLPELSLETLRPYGVRELFEKATVTPQKLMNAVEHYI